MACVFTLALQDMKYLDTASGKSDGKFFTNGDIVSCILIGTNLMIVVQIVKSSDLKRRRIFADRIRKLFTEMTVAEETDRKAMDAEWEKYKAAASPDAEGALYAQMNELVQRTTQAGTVEVAQKASLGHLGELIALSKKHEKKVHRVFAALAVRCGAEYEAGPLKDPKRITAKSNADYNGNVKKVVDVVRGTIEFPSLDGFVQGLTILVQGGEEVPEVLRAKDRLSPTTHINGLRDSLLNLVVPGTDGLVVELQLHFEALHAISE